MRLNLVQNINFALNDCDRYLRDILEVDQTFNIDTINFNKSLINLAKELQSLHNKIVVNKVGPMYYSVDKIGFKHLQEKYGVIDYDLPISDYMHQIEEVVFNSNQLEFSLPLYAELVKMIAEELKLCIDTYIDKIRRKKCILVLIKKNNQYIGCLELDTDFNYLLQAKAYDNALFDKNTQLEILKFCEENEIEVKTENINIISKINDLQCV